MKTTAILLMAYGTPRRVEDIEAYYTHIRRGNPPTKELLDELVGRYQAIGGLSPLNAITQQQSNELLEALRKQDPKRDFRIYEGMKHTSPFIADAVADIANDHVDEVIGVVLAPHYSTMSIGVYQKEAEEAIQRYQIPNFKMVTSWHLQPAFLATLQQRIISTREKLQEAGCQKVKTLFSAHSLPTRILEVNDPYPTQLQETSQALAAMAGIADWDFAWQSAGRTREPWLGPDILLKIEEIAQEGYDGILSCPVGFVADHLEVLYDIDLEAKSKAQSHGITLLRTPSLNADPGMIKAIVNAIQVLLG